MGPRVGGPENARCDILQPRILSQCWSSALVLAAFQLPGCLPGVDARHRSAIGREHPFVIIVINGVTWVALINGLRISGFQWGDISRPINGVIAVITLFMTGRGPPCRVGDVLKKKGINFYRSP